MIVAAGFVLGLAVFLVTRDDDPVAEARSDLAPASSTTNGPNAPTTEPSTTTSTRPTTTTTVPPVRDPGTVPGFTVGQPWGTTVGVTMFRGNPTRTFYGAGPVPDTPTVAWRHPGAQM